MENVGFHTRSSSGDRISLPSQRQTRAAVTFNRTEGKGLRQKNAGSTVKFDSSDDGSTEDPRRPLEKEGLIWIDPFLELMIRLLGWIRVIHLPFIYRCKSFKNPAVIDVSSRNRTDLFEPSNRNLLSGRCDLGYPSLIPHVLPLLPIPHFGHRRAL